MVSHCVTGRGWGHIGSPYQAFIFGWQEEEKEVTFIILKLLENKGSSDLKCEVSNYKLYCCIRGGLFEIIM